MPRTTQQIAATLDAAVLKPEMTRAEATATIAAAVAAGCATVCVRPCDLDLAVAACRGSRTGACVVVGFPHGSTLTAAKVAEATACIAAGATEVDMVANYGFIRSGLWNEVADDIRAVVRACGRIPVKVIIETSQLDLAQVTAATRLAADAGAAWIKTSTGFNGAGATVEAVQAMAAAAPGRIQVKASGGIRDRAAAERFLDLGCTRLGVNAASLDAILGGAAPASAGY